MTTSSYGMGGRWGITVYTRPDGTADWEVEDDLDIDAQQVKVVKLVKS